MWWLLHHVTVFVRFAYDETPIKNLNRVSELFDSMIRQLMIIIIILIILLFINNPTYLCTAWVCLTWCEWFWRNMWWSPSRVRSIGWSRCTSCTACWTTREDSLQRICTDGSLQRRGGSGRGTWIAGSRITRNYATIHTVRYALQSSASQVAPWRLDMQNVSEISQFRVSPSELPRKSCMSEIEKVDRNARVYSMTFGRKWKVQILYLMAEFLYSVVEDEYGFSSLNT